MSLKVFCGLERTLPTPTQPPNIYCRPTKCQALFPSTVNGTPMLQFSQLGLAMSIPVLAGLWFEVHFSSFFLFPSLVSVLVTSLYKEIPNDISTLGGFRTPWYRRRERQAICHLYCSNSPQKLPERGSFTSKVKGKRVSR